MVRPKQGDQVVVLHSGGQDSTTCLAWACQNWGTANVHPVTFDYGQRHSVELEQGEVIRRMLGVRETQMLDAGVLKTLGAAALTNDNIEVEAEATAGGNVFAASHGLPSTFVPGRNLLFFTLAAAYGAMHGVNDLVTGVCEADDAGYPDCRRSFVSAANEAIAEALAEPSYMVWAPLLSKTKAETFQWAKELGVLEIVLEHTHTCYEGDRSIRHSWGYGCGVCPACLERQKGFEIFSGTFAGGEEE